MERASGQLPQGAPPGPLERWAPGSQPGPSGRGWLPFLSPPAPSRCGADRCVCGGQGDLTGRHAAGAGSSRWIFPSFCEKCLCWAGRAPSPGPGQVLHRADGSPGRGGAHTLAAGHCDVGRAPLVSDFFLRHLHAAGPWAWRGRRQTATPGRGLWGLRTWPPREQELTYLALGRRFLTPCSAAQWVVLAPPREGCQLPDCLDDLNGATWAPAHSGVSPGSPPWGPGHLPLSEPHQGQTSQLCVETKPNVKSLVVFFLTENWLHWMSLKVEGFSEGEADSSPGPGGAMLSPQPPSPPSLPAQHQPVGGAVSDLLVSVPVRGMG